jgi:hypothetical protein
LINEATGKAQNYLLVQAAQKKFEEIDISFLDPNRVLLKEGAVKVVKSKKEKFDVLMYLFNDMLVLGKPKDDKGNCILQRYNGNKIVLR